MPNDPKTIEAAVLGEIIQFPDTASTVIGILQPEHFFYANHRKVYEAIVRLSLRDDPIDLQTVRAELSKSGDMERIGGPVALLDITDGVMTGANVESHAKIVLEHAINRQLADLGKRLNDQAAKGEGDSSSIIGTAQNELTSLCFQAEAGSGNTSSWQDIAPSVSERVDETQTLRKEHGKIGIARTGLTDLDRRIGGFRPGQLIIVGGRASMGKTAWATSCVVNMAYREHIPTLIFSLEMHQLDIGLRILCADANVSVARALNGELNTEELSALSSAQSRMFDMNLFIDKCENLNVHSFQAKCTQYARERGVRMVVLDYLQLMEGPRKAQNREQEVAAITRVCKKTAMANGIAIIALSQLSRAAEQKFGRADDRLPGLTDLRESGAIEQDADIVLFPWRKMEFDQWGLEVRNPEPQEAKIKVAKNRNGPVGIVRAWFIPESMTFVGYSTEDYNGG